MNTKNEKTVINDKNLESVTGGKAPELPATQLEDSEYNGMFFNTAETSKENAKNEVSFIG